MGDARETALDGARDEYRRLLYVAMTRAIDRLVVCGIDTGNRKLPAGCWYELVLGGLESESQQEQADFGDVEVWRYRKTAVTALRLPTNRRKRQ